MFRRCPFVPIVIDIELDAVLVGVCIIEAGLQSFVDGHHRQDALALEPSIGAEKIVERLVFESDVLHPPVAGSVGIGGDARHFKEYDSMMDLIVADKYGRK